MPNFDEELLHQLLANGIAPEEYVALSAELDEDMKAMEELLLDLLETDPLPWELDFTADVGLFTIQELLKDGFHFGRSAAMTFTALISTISSAMRRLGRRDMLDVFGHIVVDGMSRVSGGALGDEDIRKALMVVNTDALKKMMSKKADGLYIEEVAKVIYGSSPVDDEEMDKLRTMMEEEGYVMEGDTFHFGRGSEGVPEDDGCEDDRD
ncbi:MAG: hypothetical protein GF414_00655 [Candidatus Altiarchaeales archaeon]|nr:hypothetical protein [Candidatus Altiarchaeales archaeon]